MAAGDTQITIAGNLVDDPELRFTPAGQPVARFRVACRRYGVTEVTLQGTSVRFTPLHLPESAQDRKSVV